MRKQLYLFILLSFLLGVIAPACGFSWGGQGSHKFDVIEICTAKGIETRIVQSDSPSEETPSHMAQDECLFCFQNTHLTAFLAEPHALDKIALSNLKTKVFFTGRAHTQPISFDHAARAPPAFI